MVSLAVRDETTGQIRPWVWVVGAGFAIGGAALFLGSGKGSDSGTPIDSEGLGTGAGLDNLEQALQQLLDNMQPGNTGGGGTGGGGTGGGGTGGQVTTGGQTVKGVPGTAPAPRPTPTTGSTGTTSTTSSFGRLLGPPTPISTAPTSSPSVTGIPTGSVSTGRTAIPTGSINPYPISQHINQGPPESMRRNPVVADM